MRFNRYEGKAWDKRFFPRLSKLEVAQLPKEGALLVLPVGAVEQHGPHMPVFTDTLIAEAFLTYAFEELPEEANIWLLPPLPYGKSTEHLGHSGTITLSAQTLMQLLLDIARSVRRSGFEKLVLLNTHGGNTDLLNMMAREIRIETGLAVFRLDPGSLGLGEGLISDIEKKVGIHAGDSETSIVLAAKENWVHPELAPTELPYFPESRYLQFRNKAFAWVMDDLSSSGISGDATKATKEKGEAILKLGGLLLAEALMEMAAFEMSSLKAEAEESAAVVNQTGVGL
ncbi:creatininase family protein [Paenibacillus cremeus]|uniref:Creatininase family protein n=1 Tax=Paenibacillus cremeus TaxID=2163881 RepID=A0A559K520_9BACL|nr:creatininase family protein [Paenibacillus cremeus]TVY07239.1 creatininase family protein [Paenibacillus cremeus]